MRSRATTAIRQDEDVTIVIWLSRRSGVRMTAMAVILAGTGVVLSGAAPAAGRQLTRPSLEFTCRSPAGPQRIPAQVAVSIPGTATARQPIRPGAPVVTVTLPHAYGEQLAKVNASTVSVTAQLRSEVTENGTSAADRWVLKTVSTALPSRGDLPLRVTGAVQPVTEAAAGNARFTAAGLSLLLTPRTPSGAAATMPGTTRLDCTLNPGQTTTLATVPVVAAAAGGAAAAPATAAGHFLNGSWQAAPGGNISGTAKQVTLKDGTTGTVITCTSSSVSGTVKFGQQLRSAGIGSFSSVTMLKCTGPGSRTFTVATSASASHPWLLNAQSWDATTTNTKLTISGIIASISGSGCSATVAGPSSTAPGTVEATNAIDPFSFADTLDVSPGSNGTLHAWNVSGCSGLFNAGDTLALTASYTITPAQWVAPAFCPPFPVKNGFPFNKHFKLPPIPPGSTIIPSGPPVQACAFIEGFSDVQKLGAAAMIGPGFGNIQDGKRTVTNPSGYFQADSTGQLYYKPCPGSAPLCRAINGLPPVRSTFLSFGFVPTTATLQITQTGTLNIATVGGVQNGTQVLKFSKVQSLASIRVEKVLVNGAPLNVGRDCHTVRPFPLVLTGKPPYSLNTGGVLKGTITVPSFTGCGVGENLDPIFNATVSGPGNFVQLTQGTLCFAWNVSGTFPTGCPANMPKPVH
jgi:hypothetical protein